MNNFHRHCTECGSAITDDNRLISELYGFNIDGCESCTLIVEAECANCGTTITAFELSECNADIHGDISNCPYCEESN